MTFLAPEINPIIGKFTAGLIKASHSLHFLQGITTRISKFKSQLPRLFRQNADDDSISGFVVTIWIHDWIKLAAHIYTRRERLQQRYLITGNANCTTKVCAAPLTRCTGATSDPYLQLSTSSEHRRLKVYAATVVGACAIHTPGRQTKGGTYTGMDFRLSRLFQMSVAIMLLQTALVILAYNHALKLCTIKVNIVLT